MPKRSLSNLTKKELLTFLYNYPYGNINIYDMLAECFVCGSDPNAEYYYECKNCQKDNKKWNEKRIVKNIETLTKEQLEDVEQAVKKTVESDEYAKALDRLIKKKKQGFISE